MDFGQFVFSVSIIYQQIQKLLQLLNKKVKYHIKVIIKHFYCASRYSFQLSINGRALKHFAVPTGMVLEQVVLFDSETQIDLNSLRRKESDVGNQKCLLILKHAPHERVQKSSLFMNGDLLPPAGHFIHCFIFCIVSLKGLFEKTCKLKFCLFLL